MPPAAEPSDPTPQSYRGVTISSTFKDLGTHRDALISLLTEHGFFPVAMEHEPGGLDEDVIDASLRMVREGEAYIVIISHRYGQIPECPRRNPANLSLTELEFDEAQRLGRPTLLFLMGPDYPVPVSQVELDPERRSKLAAFRERAMRMVNSRVQRVYHEFDSMEEFEKCAVRALVRLERGLRERAERSAVPPPDPASPPPAPGYAPAGEGEAPVPFPRPPALYASPPYIGSHWFVGRRAELERLGEWAADANPHPVLLFEAIGGTGKSMLTWYWTTQHATTVREDWAGRFWYSFYEKGAVMADFCQRALAYITGMPLDTFQKKKTPELKDELLGHLQARPWLLVLDGLERVLVHYHRHDAAQLADDEAGTSDPIAERDPCDVIRPEDEDLLRTLTQAAPSKLLLTSRLTPRALLNSSGKPIPGVVRESLSGLRPEDAAALLRSCDVAGDEAGMRHYLKVHCDCHPLVTGVLAGLIGNYLPDRGNFDAWAADPAAGGGLNVGKLDLKQKRTHILQTALDALPQAGRELLATIAMLPEAVDYATLQRVNPALPKGASLDDVWSAASALNETVLDLEKRGLLQYDRNPRRFDLHPVVRATAAGRLGQSDRSRYGQRVVDYFSEQSSGTYEQASTYDDLRSGVLVVNTLVQMRQRRQAYSILAEGLLDALLFNVEAHVETLEILRSFFPGSWNAVPPGLTEDMAADLLREAARALNKLGRPAESLELYKYALQTCVRTESWGKLRLTLATAAQTLGDQRRFARRERCLRQALAVAEHLRIQVDLFKTRLSLFLHHAETGSWKAAEDLWEIIAVMGRSWPRKRYRPGDAERAYAQFRFWRGDLQEEHLATAERLASEGRNRPVIRALHGLRGRWRAERGEWRLAAESLHEAVHLAREVRLVDSAAEAELALARLHLGQLSDPRAEAARLAGITPVHHLSVAELWLAIGDHEQAEKHARAAHARARADGEPYVHRYEIGRAEGLLRQLGVGIPAPSRYDPAADPRLPWRREVGEAIRDLRRSAQPPAAPRPYTIDDDD